MYETVYVARFSNIFWIIFYILLVSSLINELKKIFNKYSFCICMSNEQFYLFENSILTSSTFNIISIDNYGLYIQNKPPFKFSNTYVWLDS